MATDSPPARQGAGETVISCEDVRHRYGRGSESVEALAGISLEVSAGSVVALIGPNGAGKSTLLNILLGLHPPTSGRVTVMGHTPWRQRRELTAVATFVSDVASLPKWIRVRELAGAMEAIHPRFRAGYFRELVDRGGIDARRECGTFSKGQLAYVHLSLALAVDASLLILDEPTLGLDVSARRHFNDRLLADYCEGGRSLVVTTHYPDELIGLVTHAVFISEGRLVLSDTSEALAGRFKVVSVPNSGRERAASLGPLYEQPVLGGVRMLFDTGGGPSESDLREIGDDISGATLSDIYLSQVGFDPAAAFK